LELTALLDDVLFPYLQQFSLHVIEERQHRELPILIQGVHFLCTVLIGYHLRKDIQWLHEDLIPIVVLDWSRIGDVELDELFLDLWC
jgi:hypothetical protein